ncbi:MAG: putative sulfate exporter family transporter [Crocinitomicaceae bacterium]|nr:putative sulfate exporter family transporter [Crocinitomicaceae bacterium]
MNTLKKEYKGISLSLLIGLLAYGATHFFPDVFVISSIILALFLGMLLGNLWKIPSDFKTGIGFTSGKLLELSILFLAFSISYTHIAKIGGASFGIIAVMVLLVLLFTFYFARKMKCPGSTGWLVGFGTAICGSSAIAALSPSVTEDKEDVGIAMAVVNLFGSIGMVVLPFLLAEMHLDVNQMGLLIGGSLHSVGNVAGAAYSMSDQVGEASITIKLARVALLSPGLIFFNFLVNRGKVTHWKQHFKLPWYLWSFIGITILSSMVDLPESFLKVMSTSGKIILTVAMAAIGLKISFKTLFVSGKKGIVFGLAIFAFQILILVIGMLLFAL